MTEYKCSPNINSTGFTPLMHAVMRNDLVEMKKIIKDSPEQLNQSNTKLWTALMLAVRNSRTDSSEEAVRILIDAKCDLNLKNDKGYTALMIASAYSGIGSTENTVKMLIDARCKLDLQDNDGWTAIMYAVRYTNNSTPETVKMLFTAGCNIELKNNNGYTVQEISLMNGLGFEKNLVRKGISDQTSKINELEKTVSEKNLKITELEKSASEKNLKITELEKHNEGLMDTIKFLNEQIELQNREIDHKDLVIYELRQKTNQKTNQ